MHVICTLLLGINILGLPWMIPHNIEGTVIDESDTRYLVDFSKGLDGINLILEPKYYSNIVVYKDKCWEK